MRKARAATADEGLTQSGGSRPVDAHRLTRKPLGLWDRIKFLVLLGVVWILLVWSVMANDPLVGFSDEGIVRHHGPDQDEPEQGQQEQELDPVPEPEGLAGQPVGVHRPALAGRRESFLGGGGSGLTHHGLLMVNDDITSLISVWSLP